MSMDIPTPDAGRGEQVIVATGAQAAKRRYYHREHETQSLAAACGRLDHDGQRLPRESVAQHRYQPCPDCFTDE